MDGNDEPILSVGDSFVDFDSLFDKVNAIQRSTGAIFIKRDSQSIAAVNKQSANRKQRTDPLDEKLKYRYIKWGCKQFGKLRVSGKGERPNQRLVLVLLVSVES
jgi:hypothetical protein